VGNRGEVPRLNLPPGQLASDMPGCCWLDTSARQVNTAVDSNIKRRLGWGYALSPLVLPGVLESIDYSFQVVDG